VKWAFLSRKREGTLQGEKEFPREGRTLLGGKEFPREGRTLLEREGLF
jgi:hypothetical protein